MKLIKGFYTSFPVKISFEGIQYRNNIKESLYKLHYVSRK